MGYRVWRSVHGLGLGFLIGVCRSTWGYVGYIRTYSGIWVTSKYGMIPAARMRPGLISRGLRVEGKIRTRIDMGGG